MDTAIKVKRITPKLGLKIINKLKDLIRSSEVGVRTDIKADIERTLLTLKIDKNLPLIIYNELGHVIFSRKINEKLRWDLDQLFGIFVPNTETVLKKINELLSTSDKPQWIQIRLSIEGFDSKSLILIPFQSKKSKIPHWVFLYSENVASEATTRRNLENIMIELGKQVP